MRLLNRTYFLIVLSFSFLLCSALLGISAMRISLSKPLLQEVIFFDSPIEKILSKQQKKSENSIDHIASSLREHFLALPLDILVGTKTKRISYKDAGFDLDKKELSSILQSLNRIKSRYYIPPFFTGLSVRQIQIRWPVTFDSVKATHFVKTQKASEDTLPSMGRADTNAAKIIAPKPGNLILVPPSVAKFSLLEEELSKGLTIKTISLEQTNKDSSLPIQNDIDVSYVLASFGTNYFSDERDRTRNLKLGAQKLDCYVLNPGQTFSFNTVVGPRGIENGYFYAGVITGGELVEGEAGGMCQLASTLHWSAVLAGLKITKTRPHSRPSAYIDPGLDSTVVYPDPKMGAVGQDLQFVNTYDFPIVLSVTVGNGEVRVKILGQRPHYKGIIWSREVKQVIEPPVEPIKNEDPEQPKGSEQVAQYAHPGYQILVTRELVPLDGSPSSIDRFPKYYPPTAQVVVIGTGSPKRPLKKIKVHRSRSIPEFELPKPDKSPQETIPHQIICRFGDTQNNCETNKNPLPLAEQKLKKPL